MTPQLDLKKQLLAWIDQRYQAHAVRDLPDYLFSNYLFHSVEPDWLEFIYNFRPEIVSYLSDEAQAAALVDYCILSTKRYTAQRNQFINYTGAYDRLLQAQYRRFLLQIRDALAGADTLAELTTAYTQVLRDHHERLRLILSSYCITYQPDDLKDNPLLNTVTCETYSARFQIRLLHLELDRLEEPILDLGCGEAGTLVRFLRDKGYAALGLDRFAPAEPYFFRQNWFEFDYSSQAWGTIIAHQAFSTHFIYNHLHNETAAAHYARLYMTLLASLKPGGSFYYTPGLPFFEPHVEQTGDYSLRKTKLSMNESLGIGEIFYATEVRKI